MTSLELPSELKAGLDAVKDRDGVPLSEQIRRAIRTWLADHGIDVDVHAGRPQARKRKATNRGRR